MSHKTTYTIIGILAALGIILFIAGFILVRQDKIPAGAIPEAISDFLPFGRGSAPRDLATKTSPAVSNGETSAPQASQSFGQLRHISARPVTGATIFERDTKTIITYMEAQTGHVYEIEAEGTRATRVSNTTIPGIQSALWGIDGEKIILRYVGDNNAIKTVAARVKTATSTEVGILEGTFLPDNISAVVISPDKQNMLYILPSGGVAVGITAQLDGTKKKQIFEFPVTELAPAWTNTNTIILATNASAFANGFLYSFNRNTGALQKLLGDIPGLTALVSNDGGTVLFAKSATDSFQTFLYTVKNSVTAAFAITALPEKCLWTKDSITLFCGAPNEIPEGMYPDSWYQGKVSFSDALWKINTETGALNILAIPEEDAREEIDLIDPMLSPDEHTLIFRNKKDSSLWSLQL